MILRAKIDEATGCWIWLGALDSCGYGSVGYQGRVNSAHRTLYELTVGPVPEGRELDHTCRNRACVNPAHLEPVTHLENMRRSAPAQKTHCVNGHPFDEDNTYTRPNGQRDCRACIRERVRAYSARKKAA